VTPEYVTVTFPLMEPVADGVKVTPIVHFACAPRLAPHGVAVDAPAIQRALWLLLRLRFAPLDKSGDPPHNTDY
jgi:hypothetical protein